MSTYLNPKVINCKFIRNYAFADNQSAPGYGGAIACYKSNMLISGCIIMHNYAEGGGGGIWGGGEGDNDMGPTIVNCTITGNTADDKGGGIFSINHDPKITNCILWGNYAGEGDQIAIKRGGGSSEVSVTYSDVQGGRDGVYNDNEVNNPLTWWNNIDANPHLTPDGHLTSDSSVCIDAGANIEDAPDTDLDGDSQPGSNYYDIGADEFVDSDSDGMPDWWEDANSFVSVDPDDATHDPDSDGLTNLQEYTNGANPGHEDNAAKTYYVNKLAGSDDYDGLAETWNGTHGPKATIQAGIDLTITGWDYVVEVANGFYYGPRNVDLDFGGKAITLKSANGADNCIIKRHPASSGVCVFDDAEVWDSVVDGFTIIGGINGAIRCENKSSPRIINCTITEGVADNGGALYCGEYTKPWIANCVLTNNTANYDGGAIYCDKGSRPRITDCTIGGASEDGNVAKDDGGAIYCHPDSMPNVRDSTISWNNAQGTAGTDDDADGDGGGICSDGSGPAIMGCTIEQNTADDNGGGIHCKAGTVLIARCTISNNSATNGDGGGISADSSAQIIVNCVVFENSAGGDGGGIRLIDDENSDPITFVVNNTIVGNSATGGGDGIYINGILDPEPEGESAKNPQIANCILWNNGGEYEEIDAVSSDTVVTYCDVEDGYDGTANYDSYPFFVDSTADNYRLTHGSPCIDVGSNVALKIPDGDDSQEVKRDRDGYERTLWRITSKTVDIGAYEFGTYFTFTNIKRGEDGAVELTWYASRPSANKYAVWSSDDPLSEEMTWTEIENGIAVNQFQATWTDENPSASDERYYRIENETTGVYSGDTVGMMWKSLLVGKNLVSSPFESYPNGGLGNGTMGWASLDSIIGDQLTGNFNKYFSDNIEVWDPAMLNYKRGWYDGWFWRDWNTAGSPDFVWLPDRGYWIDIMVFNPPKNICFVGRVSSTSRSIPLNQDRNLCGSAYPVKVSLANTGLLDSGFTGGAINFFSDSVEWWNISSENYDRVWYDTSASQWKNWDDTPATKKLKPCDGFWINVMVFNPPFTWAYPKPYTQPPNN